MNTIVEEWKVFQCAVDPDEDSAICAKFLAGNYQELRRRVNASEPLADTIRWIRDRVEEIKMVEGKAEVCEALTKYFKRP